MSIFISNRVKAEHWFLGAPGAKTKSALRKGVVFFRLCPREVTYICLSLSDSVTREAHYDLTKPVEVNAFKRVRIKAFFHKFQHFTAMHRRTKVHTSVRS